MNSSSGEKNGSADETPDPQPEAVMGKRAYATPILRYLGSMRDMTRSVGQRGANDGGRTGRNRRTSW